jgi:hypothetical protein
MGFASISQWIRHETLLFGTQYKPVKPVDLDACSQRGAAGSEGVPLQLRTYAERRKMTVFQGIFPQ